MYLWRKLTLASCGPRSLIADFRDLRDLKHAISSYAEGETLTKVALAVQAQHPCLLTHMPHFLKQAKGKRLTVFMDYDGGPSSQLDSWSFVDV